MLSKRCNVQVCGGFKLMSGLLSFALLIFRFCRQHNECSEICRHSCDKIIAIGAARVKVMNKAGGMEFTSIIGLNSSLLCLLLGYMRLIRLDMMDSMRIRDGFGRLLSQRSKRRDPAE